MSTTCCLLSEKLLCPVCQNVFSHPVTTPCGHNVCKGCITKDANADVPFQCPVCKMMFYPKPELQDSILLAEMVHVFRQSADGRTFKQQAADLVNLTAVVFFLIWACYSILFPQIFPNLPLTEETRGEMTEESIAQMEQMFSQVMKREIPKMLIRAELMRVRRYAVDVTLDPDTAHPELILSSDGKQVTCCDPNRNAPDKPKRFMFNVRVLGKQSFSSGRFYFEVQVKGKTDWILGVAKESVNRKKDTVARPQSGYWSISLRSGTKFRALSEPAARLSLPSTPETVGVFVDYDEGLVFFYDAVSAGFIYAFTGCFFTERISLFFDLSYNDAGENSAPLSISPVSRSH